MLPVMFGGSRQIEDWEWTVLPNSLHLAVMASLLRAQIYGGRVSSVLFDRSYRRWVTAGRITVFQSSTRKASERHSHSRASRKPISEPSPSQTIASPN